MIVKFPPAPDSDEDTIAAWIDRVKDDPGGGEALLALLPEHAALYDGRSTNESIRIAGYAMAAFEQAGLPPEGVPYILDELQNGRDPYLVAAAARALRAVGEPSPDLLPFLLKAIDNVKYIDDALSFERIRPQWPAAGYTTALQEILVTIACFASHAGDALPALEAMLARPHDFTAAVGRELARTIEQIKEAQSSPSCGCCTPTVELSTPSPARSAPQRALDHVLLEDQQGSELPFAAFFGRAPTVTAFFYTRCTNPNKCSLTISKLAGLQGMIAEKGLDGNLQTAAITYDPQYDLPGRLQSYGRVRGYQFDEHNRFFRATSDFADLRDALALGVNYGQVTVNRHRIELYILDQDGHPAHTFSRLQWDPAEVLATAGAIANPRSAP